MPRRDSASRHLHIPDKTSDSNHASVVTDRFSFLQTNLYTTSHDAVPSVPSVPSMPQRPPLRHNLQFQRHQLLQSSRYGGSRIRAARMPRSPTSGSRSRSRQRHDAAGLQLLQHPQTGPQSIPTLRREPAQMSAQGGSQLMAAQRRKHFHRLLEVRNLTAGQPRATEGGRLQLLDSGIHHVCTRDNLTKRRLP